MVAVTGGCQCGALRYAHVLVPELSHICHCRMCQKAVGGPFVALAMGRAQDFRWTRGVPGRFASSSMAARAFCRDCGTPLTYEGVSGEYIDVTMGSLDRPEAAPPQHQYGVEGRVGWFAGLDALPGVATEAKYAGLVSHQHPDHDI